jgi:hypothetical protein
MKHRPSVHLAASAKDIIATERTLLLLRSPR